MSRKELKQRLTELLDISCGRDSCESCEYRFGDDECDKYFTDVVVNNLIDNGVTIRRRGKWVFVEKEGYWIDDIEEIQKTGKPTKRLLPMCPFCNTSFGTIATNYDFCPTCGEDLRGEQNEL